MWEELHVFADGVSPWDWVKRKKSLEWGRMGGGVPDQSRS